MGVSKTTLRALDSKCIIQFNNDRNKHWQYSAYPTEQVIGSAIQLILYSYIFSITYVARYKVSYNCYTVDPVTHYTGYIQPNQLES